MRGRDTGHRLSRRTGNLHSFHSCGANDLLGANSLCTTARPIESVKPSSLPDVLKLELPPKTSSRPAGPVPLETFLKRKRPFGTRGRSGLEAALQALQVPYWGKGSGFQTQKEGQKAADPSLLPPNPDSLIRQITTLRSPHTYTHTHTGIQEKLEPQIQGEFGEVRLRPPARTTRTAAAPAQRPGTCK